MPPLTRGMEARGDKAPEEYAVRQKRARRPGIRRPPFKAKDNSTKTMHGKIGFDRQELQDSGALESGAAKFPTLANDIHDFFAKEKFIFDWQVVEFFPPDWDEVYEVMKPAFRLVSRWITDPIFRSFWIVLNFGNFEQLDYGNLRTGRDAYKVEFGPDVDAKDLRDLGDRLPDLFRASATHHYFRFKAVRDAWAETASQTAFDEDSDSDDDAMQMNRSTTLTSVTFLHDDFFSLSHIDFQTATESQQVRFLFFFAVNLAHQLAHHMWQSRWALENPDGHSEHYAKLDWEPFLYERLREDSHDELGISWERFMFGGRIQPLNQCASLLAPDGLAILPLTMVTGLPHGNYEIQIAPLLTDWISDQFSETWWSKRSKKAAAARRPGYPRRASVRASVNRTTDSNVFQTDTYVTSKDSNFVANHVVGHTRDTSGHIIGLKWHDRAWLAGSAQWIDRIGRLQQDNYVDLYRGNSPVDEEESTGASD